MAYCMRVLHRQGGKASSLFFSEIQSRCFHISPLTAAAAKVAMSKFDKNPLPYEKLTKNLEVVKKRLGRPLTLSEKVLYSHIDQPSTQRTQLRGPKVWEPLMVPSPNVDPKANIVFFSAFECICSKSTRIQIYDKCIAKNTIDF